MKDFSTIVIAYEPVWAIGTGKTATADEANRVCGVIRAAIAKEFGAEVGENIRIQYGGSMNAAKEKGLVRSEGKDYVMQDGDIVLFRFNV